MGEPSGKARRVSRGTVVRRAAFLLFDCPSNQSPPVHAGGFCLLFREQKMKRLCTIRVPRTPASRQQGARHDASPRRQGVAGVRLRGLAPAPVEQGAGRRQGVPPRPARADFRTGCALRYFSLKGSSPASHIPAAILEVPIGGLLRSKKSLSWSKLDLAASCMPF